MKSMHMRLDIKGAIMRKAFDGFQYPDGRPMSRRVAETHLKYELAMGKKYLPVGNCPDFDPQTGCPGHETTGPGDSNG